jgi:hypothetical protein
LSSRLQHERSHAPHRHSRISRRHAL